MQISPVGDAAPEPREGHCACILSHYLLVAGGMQLVPNGALRLLGDLHVRLTQTSYVSQGLLVACGM